MKLLLAGCPFEVEPEAALTAADRASLDSLRAPDATEPEQDRIPPFRLELVDSPPWSGLDLQAYPDHAPAAVEPTSDAIRVTHRRFAAELQPLARTGQLFRLGPEPAPIAITLRAALSACLPAHGGLPLHAAGIVLDGSGIVFFGVSGAGKSTIASLAPGPVFSDELVAVTLDPPRLRATGFWGEGSDRGGAPSEAPLAALVELAKGPSFRLERLDPALTLRRLIGVILVPPAPWLWTDTLALARRIAHERPCYRMEWSPERPPWEDLSAALLQGTSGRRTA